MKKIFILDEVIEPKVVKGVRYSKRLHNKGTNIATELHTWTFKTAKGNVVDIIFKPASGDRAYDVSFAVNKQMDATKSGGDSDKEILSGVFTLLPKLADKLGAQNLTMEAYEERSEQFRILKNKDYKGLEQKVLEEFKRCLDNEKDALVKEKLEKIYKRIFVDKEDVSRTYTLVPREGFRFQKLNALFKEYREAFLSNQEGGYKIEVNRRYNIYRQLIPRYMKDWNIVEYPNYFFFELTRKKELEEEKLNEELEGVGFDEDGGQPFFEDDAYNEAEFGDISSPLSAESLSEMAYSLAYNLGVGITNDKQLTYVLFDTENDYLIVGALFTSVVGDVYSFDIVVHRKYQRSGIGTKLANIALEHYNSMAEAYDNLKIEVDVINPWAKAMLNKKFGFQVVRKIGGDRWLMAPKKR